MNFLFPDKSNDFNLNLCGIRGRYFKIIENAQRCPYIASLVQFVTHDSFRLVSTRNNNKKTNGSIPKVRYVVAF